MSQNQTPMEEMAERVAEGAPGLAVASHLAALDNWRRQQLDYRRRVRDDHAVQVKSLGGEATDMSGDEEMGNLIVTGDIIGNNADQILHALTGGQEQPQQPQQPTEPATPQPTEPTTPQQPVQQGGLPGWAKAALIALGAAGLGAGVPWALGAYSKTSTTNINQGRESQIGVDVVPGGAMTNR